jgi:hypothetical protein
VAIGAGLAFDQVPADDEPLVQQAVKGLAELTAYQDSPEYLETLADFDLIQNFSAGPYSESRRSPREAMEARMLVAWPWLSNMLWGLMTPDKFDFWTAFFDPKRTAPAFAVQEVDWSGDFWIDRDYLWGA